MDEATARTQLETLVDADADPSLTSSEVSAILDRARRPDRAGNPITNVAANVGAWEASTVYAVGDVVTPVDVNGRYWMCVTPGRTYPTEPTWSDTKRLAPFSIGVLDNEVRWTYAGTEWTPSWDINAAAAEGWRIKAGKVAGRYNFTTDGQQFARAQMIAHCRHMERMFRRKITAGI
jgi:hypothetical protein